MLKGYLPVIIYYIFFIALNCRNLSWIQYFKNIKIIGKTPTVGNKEHLSIKWYRQFLRCSKNQLYSFFSEIFKDFQNAE